ncbi:MAG: SDR family NAD(P)-dependent oxidoreductase [Candidatus Hydrogenedentes bacterium]|nr:SDR family NAD(P)-dependent oxidoreductase [Candidatus Hydrogenedentota bacterium]
MREIRGKVALVTGAASGIGRATALALAQEGARIIICDVNDEGLSALRTELSAISECLLAERVDVADFEQMRAFADRVHELVPCVDILVNNAGVAVIGDILTTTMDDWKWLLGINLWGTIHGCHLFAPKMAEHGHGGHIVNVSSMLGYVATPFTTAYVTSKFGSFGLGLSMRADLQPYGIGVSIICPGVVKTNILQATRIRGVVEHERARDRVEKTYAKRNFGPERVARAIVRAIHRNQAIVPVTIESRLLYYLNRLCPAAVRALVGFSAERLKGELTLLHPPTQSRTR